MPPHSRILNDGTRLNEKSRTSWCAFLSLTETGRIVGWIKNVMGWDDNSFHGKISWHAYEMMAWKLFHYFLFHGDFVV